MKFVIALLMSSIPLQSFAEHKCGDHEYKTLDCEYIRNSNGELVFDDLGVATTAELSPGTSMMLASLTVGSIFMGGYTTFGALDVNESGDITITHSHCGTNMLCTVSGSGSLKSETRKASIGEYLVFDASLGLVNDGYLVIYYLPTMEEQTLLPDSARKMCDRIAAEIDL